MQCQLLFELFVWYRSGVAMCFILSKFKFFWCRNSEQLVMLQFKRACVIDKLNKVQLYKYLLTQFHNTFNKVQYVGQYERQNYGCV